MCYNKRCHTKIAFCQEYVRQIIIIKVASRRAQSQIAKITFTENYVKVSTVISAKYLQFGKTNIRFALD